MRTPLAWKNLTSSWAKCALAATGVGFAVVLMFMQIGFQRALIDNNVRVMTLLDPSVANLAIMSRARYNVSTEQRFPRSLLEQAIAHPAIRQGCVLSMERGTARVTVENWTGKPIRVLALEMGKPEFLADAGLYSRLNAADSKDGVLLDTRSKRFYGFASELTELGEQWIELNGKRVLVEERFDLGTDFGNDGTLLMSERMHSEYFPYRNLRGRPTDVVDIGFLELDPAAGLSPQQVAKQIEALSPNEIMVQPTLGLIAKEKRFWELQTPVGKIFLIGTIMGLLVGAIICYQIQFTDITEHMPEFATLKAMGYGPMYFWSLVLSQSFYLACLGFVPGIAVAQTLYFVLSESSGLIMEMDVTRIVSVWVLTLVMCAVSGALAIRKLFNADPASLF
ncbi:MAG: FtsX-like permease family protein [Pirellulaceae bacterium]